MAQKFTPPPDWPSVGKVIELFTGMGCELREMEGALDDPEGEHWIRFLYNPENQTFASLGALENDDFMMPDEVAHLERRLEMTIPKNWR